MEFNYSIQNEKNINRNYLYFVKYLSLILSIYILVLTVRPCCDDNKCADDPHQTERLVNNHNPDDHHQDEDHRNACSPFYTCGSCTGFTFTSLNFSLSPETVLVQNNVSTYHHTFFSEFYIAIWQPPKIG